jgi:hypothetical protein
VPAGGFKFRWLVASRNGRDLAEAEDTSVVPSDSAGPAKPDRNSLGVTALASAVLAREFRPRAGEIRRLAEAVLAHEAKRAARKAKKGAGKSGKNKAPKKRKLSKIPFQGVPE